MVTTKFNETESRQVLASIGNRYVLFGSEAKLPVERAFGPEDIQNPLPRIPDEREASDERLIHSLRLSGVEMTVPPVDLDADLIFTDSHGNQVLVQVKTRERDIRQSDFALFQKQLQSIPPGFIQEIWHFNLDRLQLQIFKFHQSSFVEVARLYPLDVWEFNTDGSTFKRAHVKERVIDWERRINALYANVAHWAKQAGLRTERTRSVLMSEELMQKFAVPDHELPVLDIARENQTIASFVPIGLWVIGANGRIDVVTNAGTHILVDRGIENTEWILVNRENRRQFLAFDEAAFAELVRTT